MWLYIAGMVVMGLIFQRIKKHGQRQNDILKKLQTDCADLQKRIHETDREITRLTSFSQNIKRCACQLPPRSFLGLTSKAETVAEHTHEFANEITGHRVNIWIYNLPPPLNIPARIVVAGHANGPVCREVSSAISTAYFRKDKIAEDDLFVTGAGILVNDQIPRTQEEFDKFYQTMTQGDPPPLTELVRQLHIYEKITGLIHVYSNSIVKYNQALEEIVAKIKQILISGRPGVFGEYAPDKEGILLALPFFNVKNGELNPLRFVLDESTFDCTEFRNLEVRHRQARVQEMKNDVKNRNLLYKDWLEKDEETKRRYLRMTPFERQTTQITISGARDYAKGETIQAQKSEKMSVQEHLDQHLLFLIEEDKRWIDRTDAELKRLEKSDKEFGLASQLDYTLLLDSFLRGWPSIFLTSEHERKLYDKWLASKRENVWRTICQNLLEQGIDPTTLIHTNIVFKIAKRSGKNIEIEPHYFLLSNAFLIAVDTKYGIVRYIHSWEFREPQFLPMDDQRIAESDLKNLTEQLFQAGINSLDKGNMEDAKNYFVYALRCDAEPAFLKLSSFWWQILTKDTNRLYHAKVSDPYLRSLLEGLSLPNDPTPKAVQERRESLAYCIQLHPDALPDPYIMLAILEVYADHINDFRTKRQNLEIATRRRIQQIKDDFLQGKLLHEVLDTPLTKEEFDKLNNPQYSVPSGAQRHEKEQAFEKVFMYGLRTRIQELNKGKLSEVKSETVINALQGIEEQEFIKFGISAYVNGEFQALVKDGKVPSLFARVKSNEKAKEYINSARKIDGEFVKSVLDEEQLQRSSAYWRTVGSFSEIAKADQFVKISNWIVQLLTLWQKFPETQKQMEELLQQYQEIKFPLSQDEEKVSNKLHETMESLKQGVFTNMDKMSVIMADFRSIGTDLLNAAAALYKKVPMIDFMEGNKARVLIASQNHAAYKDALRIMTESGRSLRLLTREIEGEVLDPNILQLDQLKEIGIYQKNGRTVITVKNNEGHIHDLVSLKGLTAEDSEHIRNHFCTQDGHKRIMPLGDNVGEMLLNTPMPHVPRVQRFADLLLDPEVMALLIHIMAYSNQHLVPEPMIQELRWLIEGRLKTTKDGYVVGGVHIDFPAIYQQTLNSLQA